MRELYHNAFSTCSQKVRLVLAEKGLEFVSHEIDLLGGGQHDPDYVKLNPNHVVPTLVDEGDVLTESTLINEYLEDAYPDPPMRPTGAAARHAARMWTQKLDHSVHAATGVVTFAIGPRVALLQQPEEVREANINSIPEPARRAARRSVIEHGVGAPEFAGAIKTMVGLLEAMDVALRNEAWLSGGSFGLADAALLPYVLRLDQLAMAPVIEARPHLSEWFGRVQALSAYRVAVTNWLVAPIVDLFRNQGEEVWPQVEPLTRL
jgi:glutathione S-transferase